MIRRLIGPMWRHIVRPAVFFPLVAGLAVLAVYGVIEIGLAVTGRWERDLMRRREDYRQHQPTVLVTRYEERLRAVRATRSWTPAPRMRCEPFSAARGSGSPAGRIRRP
jgi:hypothetical protein